MSEDKNISLLSQELNYAGYKQSHSNTRWTRVTSQNQADFSTTSLTTSSGLYELIIPASVLSLAKTRLQFGVTLTCAATAYSVLSANAGSYISRVSLSTLSGTLLVDSSNFSKMSQMLLPMSTSFEEINNYSLGMPQSTNAGTLDIRTAQLTLAAAKLTPNGALQRSDTAFVAVGGGGLTNIIGDSARHPSQHIGQRQYSYGIGAGAPLIAGVTASSSIFFDVALGELFRHTLMSVDKLLYFGGESLSLQIYFEAPQAFCMTPSVIPTTDPTGLYVTAGNTIVITSPTLYVKQEMNMDLAKMVMEKCDSGIEMPFSYIYTSKQVFTASSQQTVQQTINSSLGQSLLFVATAPFDAVDTGAGANSNAIIPIERNNLLATQLNNYNTFIDSIPIQSPAGFDILLGEHWRANEDNFYGSCAPLSITEYGMNWTSVDNFTGMALHVLGKNGQTIINGMSLGMNRVYSIQANWAASIAKTWYTFWAVQRTLIIRRGSVSVR